MTQFGEDCSGDGQAHALATGSKKCGQSAMRLLQSWGTWTLEKRRSSSAGALCARSGPPHGRAISAEYTRKSVYGCHLRPWSAVPPVTQVFCFTHQQ